MIKERIAGAVRPAAIVVDVGWVNGLAAIRSLGRAHVPVVAVDHRESALGFRSRYAVPVLSPDPQDEDAFVEFLARLSEELEGPIPVFPTHDEPLNAIARGAARLGERFRYPFPPWEVLQRIQSKRSQLEAAESGRDPGPALGDDERGRRRARLPGAREAVLHRRVQAALRPPGVPLRDARRGRGSLRRSRRVRAARPGVDPGR